jgi:hypothetical protein
VIIVYILMVVDVIAALVTLRYSLMLYKYRESLAGQVIAPSSGVEGGLGELGGSGMSGFRELSETGDNPTPPLLSPSEKR